MAVSNLQNFYKTKIKIACNAGTGNIYVDAKPTPTSGWLVISPGSESLREIIRYSSTGTDGNGDFVVVSNLADRGVGGTTAQPHAIGEPVRMNYTAEHQKEIDDTIEAIVNAGAPLASTTVAGRSKLSTAPVNPADPIAVGDNDPRLTIQPGLINLWATGTAPTGWLLCQGQAVSRTTYAALFAIIGTTYGSGDGSTTFNLPNLQGRVPVGFDGAQTEFDTLGETGGAKTHTLTIDQIPSHNHPPLSPGTSFWGQESGSSFGASDQSAGTNQNLATTGNTGGGQAHNNLQPYITLNYIIKT